MKAVAMRIRRRWRLRESLKAESQEVWSGFWIPLPAATFAWWVVVVRPVWMPAPEVRQALLLAYLVWGAPICLLWLVYRFTRIGLAVNLVALACLLLCAASLYTYASAAEVPLAALGTVAGATALALAARALWYALRPVRDRRMVTYLVIVLPAVLVVVVAETALWSWRQYDLWRLVAVSAIAAAMLYGVGWSARRRPALVRFLTVVAAGVILQVVAEAIQFAAGVERSQAARVLQHLGGQFLAYFGGGMSLMMLPTELQRQQENANPESQ